MVKAMESEIAFQGELRQEQVARLAKPSDRFPVLKTLASKL
jgi:hypothetical protein